MRRAIRPNFACVVWSLLWSLLFLLAASAWVYSHFRFHAAARIGSSTIFVFAITTGQLDWVGEIYFQDQGRRAWWEYESLDRTRDNLERFARFDHDYDFAGWRFGYAKMWQPGYGGIIGVPFWFLTAVFGLMAARAIRQARGANREVANRCRVCGYDLRATPDQCPECGARPVKSFEPTSASAQPVP